MMMQSKGGGTYPPEIRMEDGPFSNRALNFVTCIAAALAAFVLFTPYIVTLFGMMYLPWQGYLAGVGLSLAPIAVMEIVKLFKRPF